MADNFKVEEAVKRVWIGRDGAEFDSEKDAVWSFVREKISAILRDASCAYDFSSDDAADELRAHKADIVRWLSLV